MSDRAADVGDLSPTSLSHLIGQRAVVEQARVALDAAQMDGKKFDHALLVGPPGCGKTQTAKVIAAEMASDYHEVLGQAVQTSADLNALLLCTKDRDVVLIDEAHELGREYQTALYLAMDQKKVIVPGGKSGRSPRGIPLADFSLLLATTDEYALLQPLRDRMRLVLRFAFYPADELVELLVRRCRTLRWSVDPDVLPDIARRSRGTPRLALRLLQAARRVARSEGEAAVSPGHLRRACHLEGTDEIGLGPVEQQYLDALAAGTNRLNVLASVLGLPARTVSQVTEPFLLRAGLIMKDDQGRRHLTPDGREHLAHRRA